MLLPAILRTVAREGSACPECHDEPDTAARLREGRSRLGFAWRWSAGIRGGAQGLGHVTESLGCTPRRARAASGQAAVGVEVWGAYAQPGDTSARVGVPGAPGPRRGRCGDLRCDQVSRPGPGG